MASSTTSTAVTSASAAPIASSTTSSPTTFDTSTSTTAPPVILTTPYSFPQECDTVSWNITAAERPVSGNIGADYIETFLYLPWRDNEWASTMSDYYRKCHRPAVETDPYAAMDPYRPCYQSAVYRGAVCPKDWMAFEVGMTSGGGVISRTLLESTWSSAFCCKSGDKLDTVVWKLSYEAFFDHGTSHHACIQTITSHNKILGVGDFATKLEFTKYVKANESVWTETRTVTGYPQTTYPDDQTTSISTWTNTITWYDWDRHDITTTVYWPGGRAFYPAWSIEWTAEDNATLDPPWPTLTSDMLIPTWTPGMPIPSGLYDRKGEGSDRRSPTPQTKLGKIGAPIVGTLAGVIGLLLMLAVVLWCLRRRRAGKREIRRQTFLQELDVRSGEDGPARRIGSLTLNPEDRRE